MAEQNETPLERGHRKERVGVVASNKMDKTVVVVVERRVPHPQYKKYIKRFSRFYAHDDKNEALEGDRVLIQETRPISKNKSWRLVKVLEKNEEAVATENSAGTAES